MTTFSPRFPTSALAAYIEQEGGVSEILSGQGLEYGSAEFTTNERRINRLVEPERDLFIHAADAAAIELFQVHPSLIWPTWFDPIEGEPDYDAVEAEVLAGRFASREEMWQWVEDTVSDTISSRDRVEVIRALSAEARAVVADMPMKVGERVPRRPAPLAVGSTCRNGHKIESEADLVRNGLAPDSCRECRRATAARQRNKKRKQRAGQAPKPVVRKLSPENVADIRKRLATGEETQASIAADFGVSQKFISAIKRGERYKQEDKAA